MDLSPLETPCISPGHCYQWHHTDNPKLLLFSPCLAIAQVQVEGKMQKVRKCLFESVMKETLLEWTFWLDFIKHEYGYLVMNDYLQEQELRCGAWNPFPPSNTCWCYRGRSHLEGLRVEELLSLGLSSNAALARHNEGRACINLIFNLILFTWEGSGLAAAFLPFWICFLKKMEKSSLLHQCFQPQKKWKQKVAARCS